MAKIRGIAETPDTEKVRIPGSAQDEFRYMHHPGAWECFLIQGEDGKDIAEFLPVLKEFRFRPGVNGIKKPKDGGPRHAIADRKSTGWIFLPYDIPTCVTDEDGEIVDDVGYLKKHHGYRGAIWRDIWSVPVMLGVGRNAELEWEFDRRAFDEWRRRLIRDGHLPPITAAARRRLISIQKRRVGRRAEDAHEGANPIIRARQETKARKLEAMEMSKAAKAEAVYKAKVTTPRAPPKPKRGRPKKGSANA